MESDNKQATVMNILVAHENMDEKTAYNIVKTIFDKRDDLIAVHKEAVNFKLENQKAAATPIPFHPGALKYFRREGRQAQLSAAERPRRIDGAPAAVLPVAAKRRPTPSWPTTAWTRQPNARTGRAGRSSATRRSQRAEEFVEEEEGAANKLRGWLGVLRARCSPSRCRCSTSTPPMRSCRRRSCGRSHVAFVLALTFLLFPVAKRFRHRVMWWDWLPRRSPIAVVVYMLQGGDDFTDRNTLARTAGTSCSASA